MKASMEAMEASMEAVEASMEAVEASTETLMSFHAKKKKKSRDREGCYEKKTFYIFLIAKHHCTMT